MSEHTHLSAEELEEQAKKILSENQNNDGNGTVSL